MAKYSLPKLPAMGDSRTIDQYKDFGDWGQNRGAGTLQALANLLQIGGGIAQQSEQEKQDQAYKNAIMSMVQEKNLLPGIVPDKIDTTGMDIPFNQKRVSNNDFIERNNELPTGIETVQNGVDTIQSKRFPGMQQTPGTMSEEETSSMYDPYKEMGTQQILQMIAQKQAMQPKPKSGSAQYPKNRFFGSLSEDESRKNPLLYNIARDAASQEVGIDPTSAKKYDDFRRYYRGLNPYSPVPDWESDEYKEWEINQLKRK